MSNGEGEKCASSFNNDHFQKSNLLSVVDSKLECFVKKPLLHFLENLGLKDFSVTDYRSQALRGGSDAAAAAYVQVSKGERQVWGCGHDPSIEMAGLKALICALNLSQEPKSGGEEESA